LLGLAFDQRSYPPDLATPIKILRDAIEAQSARALALQAEVMNPPQPLRRAA
jgi:hypothetical protein